MRECVEFTDNCLLGPVKSHTKVRETIESNYGQLNSCSSKGGGGNADYYGTQMGCNHTYIHWRDLLPTVFKKLNISFVLAANLFLMTLAENNDSLSINAAFGKIHVLKFQDSNDPRKYKGIVGAVNQGPREDGHYITSRFFPHDVRWFSRPNGYVFGCTTVCSSCCCENQAWQGVCVRGGGG